MHTFPLTLPQVVPEEPNSGKLSPLVFNRFLICEKWNKTIILLKNIYCSYTHIIGASAKNYVYFVIVINYSV